MQRGCRRGWGCQHSIGSVLSMCDPPLAWAAAAVPGLGHPPGHPSHPAWLLLYYCGHWPSRR